MKCQRSATIEAIASELKTGLGDGRLGNGQGTAN